jgi:hypothetical protein
MKHPDPDVPQALLICGLLSTNSQFFKQVEADLEAKYGSVCLRSEIVPFTWTDYYNSEMGEGLLRRWVIFSEPVSLIETWRYKKECCIIEDAFRQEGNRRLNIDPGFIRMDGLWLLTTKSAGHRTYLDEGIWIELTLRFLRDRCEELPWTYPDHRDPAVQVFFMKAREYLKKRMADV